MTRAHYLVLTLILAFYTSISSAQVTTGTPPFGSFGGGPDVINLANLNSHTAIPVLHKPGRGTNFTYDLSYDSSVWYPVTSGTTTSWQPVYNWGWRAQTEIAVGYVSRNGSVIRTCRDRSGNVIGQQIMYSNWVYHDPWGIPHAFAGYTLIVSGTCGTGGPTTFTATSDQYTIVADAGTYDSLHDASGKNINAPLGTGVGSASMTDRNGNQISVSTSGAFTDTLGTTALTVSGSGTPASPMVFSYAAPSATASYKVNYTNYTVATNFAVSGIAEYKSTAAVPLVSSIVLPDNSQYAFTYEATLGTCTPYAGTTCVTARVTKVTLPTGGSITYAYSGGASSNGSGILSDGSTATLGRTVYDGSNSNTWSYAQVKGTGAASTTTVTDPQGNVTTIQFQGIYETQRQVGSLLTTNTCYNGAASPCTGSAITLPITSRSITNQLGTSGPIAKQVFTYNNFGLVTEEDDYDFPSGASLLKKTLITYASLANNINAFRQTTTVYDGANKQIAQTTNNYDETTPTATSGVPQHVAVSGSRGNLTSVSQWVNTTNTNLTSHATYYDTGAISTATAANGAVATYNYPDATSTCNDAFPKSVSEPMSMSRSFVWNCTGGVLTSVTDENSQTTTTTYGDPYFWRPASQNFPDGGRTSWTYNSPTSTTTTTKMNSSQSIVSTTLLDGLGRTSQTQLTSDQQGTDYNVTTYDALGRVGAVYNPTRCNPPTANCGESTWGIVSYGYDALNRRTSVTDPDGSAATASYSNNTTTVTDEAGKKRQLQTDALGRITQVTEDPGGLGYVTTYGYDALNNLTSVSGSNQRGFNYDSLSRLTSETNPESGIVNYKYDADSTCGNSAAGMLASRADARGIRTCYSYDALNRLTGKSSSDATPPVILVYDSGGNATNALGRLVEVWTGHKPEGVNWTGFSYDSVGRLNLQRNCINYPWADICTNVLATGLQHDLAGNLTQMTYPSGRVVQQSFDSAGRLCAIAASTSNCSTFTNPYATAFTYNPASQMTAFTYGNGVAATFGLSNRLQRTSLKYAKGSSTLFSLNYAFGSTGHNNGQISGITDNVDNGRSASYGYDSLNRLWSALTTGSTNYPQWGLSWTYDRNANRTAEAVTAGTGPSNSVSVDATTNHINTSGYAYDTGGNMTNDGGNTLAYDAENRVTSATNAGASGSYAYSGTGLRVHKVSGAATTDSVYSGSQVIAQYDNQQGVLGEYIYAGGQQLAALGGTGISNGGFEQGATNWNLCVGGTQTQIITDPTRAHSGNNYVQMSTSGGACAVSTQFLPVSTGDQVTWGGWAYLESGNAIVHWNIIAYDINKNPVNYLGPSPSTVSAAAWTYQAGAYSVPSGVAYVVVYAETINATAPTVARFDDGFISVGTHYYHPDHLSTRLITDASGNLVGQQGHFPFGETWYAQNSTSKWQFTSYEHDAESGNEYALARSYINRLARFSSPDPAGLAAVNPSNPQTWNRYAYVTNSPLSNIDPTGLACYPIEWTIWHSCSRFMGNGVSFGSNWNEFDLMNIPVTSGGEMGWRYERVSGPSSTMQFSGMLGLPDGDYTVTSSILMAVWGPLPGTVIGNGFDLFGPGLAAALTPQGRFLQFQPKGLDGRYPVNQGPPDLKGPINVNGDPVKFGPTPGNGNDWLQKSVYWLGELAKEIGDGTTELSPVILFNSCQSGVSGIVINPDGTVGNGCPTIY